MEQFKIWMKRKGVTVREAAAILNISVSYLYKLLSGEREPTVRILRTISRITKKSIILRAS